MSEPELEAVVNGAVVNFNPEWADLSEEMDNDRSFDVKLNTEHIAKRLESRLTGVKSPSAEHLKRLLDKIVDGGE